MELNFFAAAELTREVLPSMRARSSGHILNLTSIGGLHALRGFSAYCASKFALEGWSEALHDESAPLGLHVTIVEPGGFRTEFSGPKNMRPAGRIAAYRAVIEPIEELLYGTNGKQVGDPRKAAKAMIAAVEVRSRPCGCYSAPTRPASRNVNGTPWAPNSPHGARPGRTRRTTTSSPTRKRRFGLTTGLNHSNRLNTGPDRLRRRPRRGEDIVPIPGSKRVTLVERNIAADSITLTPEDLARLNELGVTRKTDRNSGLTPALPRAQYLPRQGRSPAEGVST